jgi:glycosyltransferase involved in cell wall biosynthesis
VRILVVSKYGRTPACTFITRQFYLSKYFARQGHDVTLVTSVSNGEWVDISGYEKRDGHLFRRYETVNHWLLEGPEVGLGLNLTRIWSMILFEWRLFTLKEQLVEQKPDVVLVSSLALQSIWLGIYLKWATGCKLVFEIRDIWPLTIIELGGFSPRNPFVRLMSWLEKWGYERADLVVGTMPALENHVRGVSSKAVPVVNVPMGYDPEFFEASDPELPGQVDEAMPPKEAFVVGYAGAIGTANGINLIVDTAALLEQQGHEIWFVLIGNGPLSDSVRERTSGFKRFVLLPGMDRKYVNAFLKRCDVLVNPILSKSIYRYGVSPNKWIDYMYSARPIISPYDGYPSILNEAGCGVFIEPENPEVFAQTILEFASKPALELDAMGARGRDYLQKHLSYEVLASDYLHHIERISA